MQPHQHRQLLSRACASGHCDVEVQAVLLSLNVVCVSLLWTQRAGSGRVPYATPGPHAARSLPSAFADRRCGVGDGGEGQVVLGDFATQPTGLHSNQRSVAVSGRARVWWCRTGRRRRDDGRGKDRGGCDQGLGKGSDRHASQFVTPSPAARTSSVPIRLRGFAYVTPCVEKPFPTPLPMTSWVRVGLNRRQGACSADQGVRQCLPTGQQWPGRHQRPGPGAGSGSGSP